MPIFLKFRNWHDRGKGRYSQSIKLTWSASLASAAVPPSGPKAFCLGRPGNIIIVINLRSLDVQVLEVFLKSVHQGRNLFKVHAFHSGVHGFDYTLHGLGHSFGRYCLEKDRWHILIESIEWHNWQFGRTRGSITYCLYSRGHRIHPGRCPEQIKTLLPFPDRIFSMNPGHICVKPHVWSEVTKPNFLFTHSIVQ